MSILVPLLIVLGLVLLTWCSVRMMWGSSRDKVVGGFVLVASVASLSAGAIGFFESIRKARERCYAVGLELRVLPSWR